jgi:hypothetical protein
MPGDTGARSAAVGLSPAAARAARQNTSTRRPNYKRGATFILLYLLAAAGGKIDDNRGSDWLTRVLLLLPTHCRGASGALSQ